MTTSATPFLRRSSAVLLIALGTAAALGGCDRRTPTTDGATGGTGTSGTGAGSTGSTGSGSMGSGTTSTTPMPSASAASR